MDTRLLAHYNRELQHLRDMAGEFAAEYPKIAGRLSLDGFECADPYVERLLEGFAFLAARVQLKFDSGYSRFTQHLLETVYPSLLAPLPSMLIAQFEPDLRDANLAAGFTLPRGSALKSRIAPDEQTACDYRTGHATTLWPLTVRDADYLARPGDLAAIGLAPQDFQTLRPPKAGIRLRFDIGAGLQGRQLALNSLPLYLRGSDQIPARLYEQLLGHGLGFVVRPVGGAAPWQVFRDGRHLRALGFSDDEALLPASPRGFSGYRLLQEYFAFPSRFQFVALDGLKEALTRCEQSAFEIVVLLDRSDPALDRAVDGSAFALNCVPAINLFPKHADRILINDRDTDHHLVVDRTRPMDFEVHSVTGVIGHGTARRQAFEPFYAPGRRSASGPATGYYTLNRLPRRVSTAQRRKGMRSSYLGSETYLSLVDAQERAMTDEVRELSVETLCTNRDLPFLMPIGGSDDLRLDGQAPLTGIRCIKGPTRPMPPHSDGESHWRLINQLSLNYLSLVDGEGQQGAAALRDLLGLYGDTTQPAIARQIEGLVGVSQRAVHRRLPSPGPIAFGRGLEITLSCDDAAFEGSGAFLLGAVLEQFFARYVSINSFTETVLRSSSRGELKRWPTRLGRRQAC